jgi:phosphodiesterase/alkaline phosphatase D-like protein
MSLVFDRDFQLLPINVTTLIPNTKYFFGQTSETGEKFSTGSFKTPGEEGTPFNFRIATGGCQLTASNSKVFDLIKEKDPLLFLHGGDFHYMDLDTESVDLRIDAFDRVFGSETASNLYTNVAFAYMWDDHDLCANVSRPAVS